MNSELKRRLTIAAIVASSLILVAVSIATLVIAIRPKWMTDTLHLTVASMSAGAVTLLGMSFGIVPFTLSLNILKRKWIRLWQWNILASLVLVAACCGSYYLVSGKLGDEYPLLACFLAGLCWYLVASCIRDLQKFNLHMDGGSGPMGLSNEERHSATSVTPESTDSRERLQTGHIAVKPLTA